MGGKNSKEKRARHKHSSLFQSTSSFSGNQYGGYPSLPPPATAPPADGVQPPRPHKKLNKRYSRIADNYNSLEQYNAFFDSKLPLSIVLVGVGDGPWDMMKEFDDNIPDRYFDNFQFVNFTEILSKDISQIRKKTEFALAALMEIPAQYKATIELNLLGSHNAIPPRRAALPPPIRQPSSAYNTSEPLNSTSHQTGPQSNYGQSQTSQHQASISNSTYDNQVWTSDMSPVRGNA
ncbi:hypothetical protein L1887_31945 [Cichorium endivia]|nr:hypothetical protein L1887_31945 [Cichorium endivia]